MRIWTQARGGEVPRRSCRTHPSGWVQTQQYVQVYLYPGSSVSGLICVWGFLWWGIPFLHRVSSILRFVFRPTLIFPAALSRLDHCVRLDHCDFELPLFTALCTWHDAFVCVTWLFYMHGCLVSPSRLMGCSCLLLYVCVATHSYEWLIHMCTWHTYVCDMPHAYVWHASFV